MELKKKSISIHTVVTIVLAVLLALSLALGLTGAWFTDKATGSSTVNFGEVKLGKQSITITPASTTALLPSQKITLENPQYKGVAAYYRISITVSGANLPSDINTKLGASTKYGYIAAKSSLTNIDNFPSEITIPDNTGNDFQNVTCTLTVTVEVIQQEGIGKGTNDAAAQAAFEAKYPTVGTVPQVPAKA